MPKKTEKDELLTFDDFMKNKGTPIDPDFLKKKIKKLAKLIGCDQEKAQELVLHYIGFSAREIAEGAG